jgi:N-acetyl-anhydromuramyl-L-alanine amidase AmpD
MAVMTYKEGSKGAVVKQIQKVVGCYPDGIWGRLTTESVKAWQQAHGLTADGIAGPRTLAAMGIAAVTPQTGASSAALSQVTACYGGKAVTLKKSKRRIDEIIVHCTATPEGRDLTVEQIRAGHLQRGFSEIGYHYVVYRDGTVHVGRNVDVSGAHVTGYNSYSIGIAYVGGLENRPGVAYSQLKAKDTRTDQQKASLLALLIDLRKLYPTAKIQGHRDFSPDKNHNGIVEPSEWIKDCPSFDAKMAYQRI